MKYDGGSASSGAAWRSITRNYIITKAPDAEAILGLVESNEDVVAPWAQISTAVHTMFSERVQRIAQEVWGHLNLCLSGAVRRIF